MLAGLGSAAACSRATNSENGSDAGLKRAAQFLWSQQGEDGGWHSKTYGLLRSGQSLTPFVLDALLLVPESVVVRPAGAIARAFDFLRKNTDSDGQLGLADSSAPDYPNYATGLAVRAAVRTSGVDTDALVKQWISCLRSQQFFEDGGWKRNDPSYGAWGMGGARLTPPDAGHVDLAMTRYVLEGLTAAGVPANDPAMQRAQVYLDRCQNPDGGFFFSTVNRDTNKAGDDSSRFRSYGSTTADGILALRACGVRDEDPRIQRATKWLRDNHKPNRVPGFDGTGPRESWAEGLRYYYAAAITRALPGLPVLLPPQRHDGSWANSSNLVKEDDPLIATPFALRVLCHDKGG